MKSKVNKDSKKLVVVMVTVINQIQTSKAKHSTPKNLSPRATVVYEEDMNFILILQPNMILQQQ